ncbi:hypothetical protein MSAN_01638700 [Mycena sanguinolenta]|uniref:Uncharacterized protein n=1 Tax=Mycena sanguinolenta TaxID=230812 RepID=A0A8H6XYQ3_9AGAR|nr:hypothetical protein MSAN_01638700 [Mycena sanguinolenta]
MTNLRSIYLLCEPLPHKRLRVAHGSSHTSGSGASAAVISHWSIIISAETKGSFDRYELFQHHGQILVDHCGGGKRSRYMRKNGGVEVHDLGYLQQDKQDLRDHSPLGNTNKSHADIVAIIQDNPIIKQIWEGEYNLVTNNCQNFVVQILKLIAFEPPPQYYSILLKQQGTVISKLWSYREVSREPPAHFGNSRKRIGSYRFKGTVTQQKINNAQQDEFCPDNIRVAQWYPFSETALFSDVFDLSDGYCVTRDEEAWYILAGKMLEDVSHLTVKLEPDNVIRGE